MVEVKPEVATARDLGEAFGGFLFRDEFLNLALCVCSVDVVFSFPVPARL